MHPSSRGWVHPDGGHRRRRAADHRRRADADHRVPAGRRDRPVHPAPLEHPNAARYAPADGPSRWSSRKTGYCPAAARPTAGSGPAAGHSAPDVDHPRGAPARPARTGPQGPQPRPPERWAPEPEPPVPPAGPPERARGWAGPPGPPAPPPAAGQRAWAPERGPSARAQPAPAQLPRGQAWAPPDARPASPERLPGRLPAVSAPRGLRWCWMRSGRIRPTPGAWPSRPCSQLRTLWRVRRPGPWPLFSFWSGLAHGPLPQAGTHRCVLIERSSQSTCFRSVFVQMSLPCTSLSCITLHPAGFPSPCRSTNSSSPVVSSGPVVRRARTNARRRSARVRHSTSGCTDAPRPGSRRRGSGTATPSTTTTRSRSAADVRSRQPTQVRCGLLMSRTGR